MDTSAVLTIIGSTLSLAGLWWVAFSLYPQYRVDALRQGMFELRDKMFDASADGLIEFDHPAYGLLRKTMNGFIRFGHRLSMTSVVGIVVFGPGPTEGEGSFDQKWNRAMQDLPEQTQARMNEFRQRMIYLVARHLVVSSPLLMLTVIVPLVTGAILRHWMAWSLQVMRSPLNRITSAAMECGSQSAA
jgi:hypothetical protein